MGASSKMFTKTQHNQIAEIIKQNSTMIYQSFDTTRVVKQDSLISAFIILFETENSLFDYEKFIANCLPDGKEWDFLR
jgi:hypothetical protein